MNSFKKIPLKIWVISVSFLIIFSFSWGRLLNNYELITYDLRFRIRPPLKVTKNIVIIQVSDDDLKNLDTTWPLPRSFHADIVTILKEAGARMIVFDFFLSEPTSYDEDKALLDAIKKAGNVYLAFAFHDPKGNRFPVHSDTLITDIHDNFKQNAAGVGHINVSVDSDGKTRRVPLFIKYGQDLFPQLGFKAACDWLKADSRNVAFKGNKLIIDNKIFLPVQPDGFFLVNYPGTWLESFQHFTYSRIFKAYLDKVKGISPELDLSVFKDKVCFIGITATGGYDLKPNPLESNYPMLGLLASVFNSVLTNEFIAPAGLLLNTLINLVIFVLSLIVCLRLTPLKAFGSSIIFGIAYFIIAAALFIFLGFWIDLFLPLLIIALTYIGATSYRFFNETKKRQLLEKELDIARAIQKSFLPKDLKEFSGISISSFMQPAKFVAGDLYDIVIVQGKKVGVFIGDVSGKGVPASLIMAQTISLFRVFVNQYIRPSEVLNRLNKELYGRFEGRFVTSLYMIIDPQNNKVQVSSAGHAPVLLYRKNNNAVSEVELDAGMPLGIMEEVEYADVDFDLGKNDKIMVFTDGLTEARNCQSREFGLDSVKKIIFEHRNASSDKILNVTTDELFRFSHRAPQHDDITIIVLANQKEE